MIKNNLAPIVIFTYARPWHFQMTLDALRKNDLAKYSELIIYSDGFKGDKDKFAVLEVRKLAQNIQGFASVKLIERSENFGLSKSIISGVTEVLRSHKEVIVLEDDLITSPYFLEFMNDGLKTYASDESVASIHGYIYPIDIQFKDNFFLKGADCWGWATWRRAWELFNPSGRELLDSLVAQELVGEFEFSSTYPYLKMLKEQIEGRNDSWAIRWYASTFLKNKYTLYPRKSLVKNIGLDGSGTHCNDSNLMDTLLSDEIIKLERIPITQSWDAYEAFGRYFSRLDADNKLMKVTKKSLDIWSLNFIFSVAKRKLIQIYYFLHKNEKNYCDGAYYNWDEASRNSIGYNDQEILQKTLRATLAVKEGKAAYERDSVLFDEIQYSWPLTSGLLLAGIKSNGKLNVLDYGGSLGSSYFQNILFLKEFKEVKWNVIEQAHYVDVAKKYIEDEELKFFENIDDLNLTSSINVALLSSVLPYIKNPFEVLKSIIDLTPKVIIIDRTPFNIDSNENDIIRIQHVPKEIYSASYPCRFFNENNFVKYFEENGYKLLEKFLSLDRFDNRAVWRGMIFLKLN